MADGLGDLAGAAGVGAADEAEFFLDRDEHAGADAAADGLLVGELGVILVFVGGGGGGAASRASSTKSSSNTSKRAHSA